MRNTKRCSNRRKRARSVVDESFDKMENTKRWSNRRKRARSVVDESRNNGGVIEKRWCWSDLPSDLLEPIMSKLFFINQINFRAVCKSWHQVLVPPVPLKQMPWLMVFDDREWNSCKLVDPTYKKTYTIDMSFMNNKKNLKDGRLEIHESKYGWLLMSCVSDDENLAGSSHSLFLYSPFFIDNNIIELPVLSVQYYYIATFDLILNPSKKEEGFEVLVLSSDTNGTICIKTCRQGDNSWSCNKTIWNFQLCMINCWVYSEGIFYYATQSQLGKESKPGSYDIARNNWTKFPTLVSVLPLGELNMIMFDGEIYLISVHKNGKSWGLTRVYIYKFNLLKGTWESIELHDLNNRVLFVGDEYSSILELDNDVEELKDQKQKVYYCCNGMVKGSYATVLKHCNALNQNRSYGCSKWYGRNQYCGKLWIDPPRRIKNSI